MKNIIKFLKFWSAFWTTPVGIILFYFSPFAIHYLDPTAEVLTIGQIQKIIFVIAGMFIVDGLVWFMIYLNFPGIFKQYRQNYGTVVQAIKLTEWEQRKYLLSLLCIYFFAAVFLAIAAAI